MLFYSKAYLIFFLIVFVAYWAMPWRRARVWLLVSASFFFYAKWNEWLALIICVSTMMDWLLALGMEAATSSRRRKIYLGVSIVGNLGLLCYFKYMNFFMRSVEQAMHAVGAASSLPVLEVILPIGISFYTFEAISYTMDVYRRRIPAEKNLFHFMLFITFFPHLIAGPIVRARDFLPQIRRTKHWNWARLHLGLQFFMLGLVKKLIIGDRMAMFCDPVFAAPADFGTGAVWLAVLAYAVQIYCDFSGYSDMAIGSAHMLGYKLAKNFDMPYFAANISDFWRRWHISLSSWLRDYLFIPLGGSRGSRWTIYRNFMIVMTLGGLWHGAAKTFILWGMLHGVFLIVHRLFREFCERRPTLDQALQTLPGLILRMAMTFGCVAFAWIFFRAQSFSAAVKIIKHLVPGHGGLPAPLTYHCLAILGGVMLLCHLAAYTGIWRRLAFRLPPQLLGVSYAAMLTLVFVLTPETGKVFIYFQF